MRNPLKRIRRTEGEHDGEAQLTPTETLRIRMWEARSSHSRSTGMALLGTSGVFLALSFLTAFAPFEILALVSFVVGVFLISVELEPRVKLLSSAESLMGPLLALTGDLKARGLEGSATYVPGERGVTMSFSSRDGSSDPLDLVPVGRGLVVSVEREVGSLKDAEFTYVKDWVPKAFEKGLNVVERATLNLKDWKVEASFNRPFVRPLCVNDDFNEKVCARVGCPLVSSVGEIIASSTGKQVAYHGCSYDRMAETSRAMYELKAGD